MRQLLAGLAGRMYARRAARAKDLGVSPELAAVIAWQLVMCDGWREGRRVANYWRPEFWRAAGARYIAAKQAGGSENYARHMIEH
jgi:hypothetical protein